MQRKLPTFYVEKSTPMPRLVQTYTVNGMKMKFHIQMTEKSKLDENFLAL